MLVPALLVCASWSLPAVPVSPVAAAELVVQDPQPAPSERGRRGRGQRGDAAEDQAVEKPEKKPKPGIPVTDTLLQARCVGCHPRDERGHMSRISYERKSPEGWSETLKRMGRLYQVQLSTGEAKHMVRYLASEHGLTRSEAERALYESERRVHWSEEHHDSDFKQACAQCHTLGRVLAQQRDEEEWQLLRSMHVAYFPLSRGQMGGGPPRNEEEEAERRFWRNRMAAMMGGGGGGATGQGSGQGGGQGGATPAAGARRGGADASAAANVAAIGPTPEETRERDRGDRVLKRLADEQPLLTDAWDKWQISKREVPLAGRWFVTGHEVGRGDTLGIVEIRRTGVDEFETRWQLTWPDGATQERSGKGLLYAGYSWRGSATEGSAPESRVTWREVLLLDEGWRQFKGRLFRGDHDELGIDVELHRLTGVPRVLALRQRAVTVPAEGQVIEVLGEAFPAAVQASDFHLGAGVTVRAAERVSDSVVRLTLDVSPAAVCGERTLSYLADPGRASVVLYDGIDYVRIAPVQGLARIGGGQAQKQIERFEAIAVHRGKDGKPFTDDDVDVMMVKAKWSLAEFSVREDDDDVKYVGAIEPETGVFTPSIDGPNQQRKWQANNVGDVFVVAECEFDVPVRVATPAADTKGAPGKEGEPKPAGEAGGEGKVEAPPPAPKPAPAPPPASAKPDLQRKSFKARGHLLVTVPRYIRWDRLEWEDR